MAEGGTGENLILRLRVVGARLAQAEIKATQAAVGSLEKQAIAAGRAGDRMARGFKRGGSKMREAGYAMTRGLTMPIMLVGGAAAKLSMDFTQQMTSIQTQAGASASEVAFFRREILKLAPATTQGPNELAKGLYHLRSVGLRGAKALDALKISAQGATVGNADLEETATALGSVWRVGVKESGNLRTAMGMLNATVGAGNMRFSDLIHALGTGILAAGKAAGLTMLDLMGATAVFTDEGYKASSATTQMATALHYFTNPGLKSEQTLKDIGLSVSQLSADFRHKNGLLTALTDLKKHLDAAGGAGAKFVKVRGKLTAKNKAAVIAERLMGNILPGGRGRIMLVLMNQLETYRQKMEQITGTQGKFGASVKKSMETPLSRLRRATSAIHTDLISIGDDIVPLLVPAFDKFARAVHSVTKRFKEMSPEHRSLIIRLLAVTAIAGPLITTLGFLAIAIGGIAMAMKATIFTPTGAFLVFAALAAVGLYRMYKHSKWLRTAIHNVGTAFGDAATSAKRSWDDLVNTVANAYNNIKWIVNKAIGLHNLLHPNDPYKKLPSAHFGSHWDKQHPKIGKDLTSQAFGIPEGKGKVHPGPGKAHATRDLTGALFPDAHGVHKKKHHETAVTEALEEIRKNTRRHRQPPVVVTLDGKEIARAVERVAHKKKATR